jgi:hypothetical protein
MLSKMDSKRVVVRLRPGSDGDPTHLPREGRYTELNPPTLYLEKIGQQWMEARGEARPGIKYILESLPAGYSLWHRPRPKSPSHFDKYLYGHPSRKPFDSPNRFYPHFEYLMNNAGDSMGCPCTVCVGDSGVLPKSSSNANTRSSSTASSRDASLQTLSHLHEQPKSVSHMSHVSKPSVQPTLPQHKGRHKTVGVGSDMTRVDEEGTPDIYRNLIDKLRRYHTVDEEINETMSLDWRSEQQMLPEWIQKLKDQSQWNPRVGEIVLYVRQLPKGVHVVRRSATGNFDLYNEESKEWTGSPVWEAGLVGQTPTEPITIEDIYEDRDKKSNVTYYGIRVEPLPSANDTDKSLSKRHVYVPLRQIRPFVLWKQLLHRVSMENWHPTISNALTATSNLSLLGKHRFRGSWPDAQIYCHGVYIGHELLAVGDTVRLLPKRMADETTCQDIMVIKSIRLKWLNLDQSSNNDWDDGQPCRSEVWIYGTAYTSEASRSSKEWLSEQNLQLPKASGDYTEWYPLHPTSKELAVPFHRILGRLFEYKETAVWLNSNADNLSILDAGREAVLEGRKYSQQHDKRITAVPGVTWYWGDSRSQALDLHTINNVDVSKYDQKRDPREYRKKIKVLEAMAHDEPLPISNEALPAGARNLRAFMAPSDPDLMGPTHLSRRVKRFGANGGGTASSMTGERSIAGGKRSRTFDLSDTEDGYENEEEIRQHTTIVDDSLVAEKKKKSRVMVVIG